MDPATHFLFGMLCGLAVASVGLVFRRRWAAYLPPFVLACGLWAELPLVLGFGATRHPLANVFFGYAWLHPWVGGRALVGLAVVVAVASLLLAGYVAFTTWFLWTVDAIRWEQTGGRSGRRSRRRREKE
ncbi:MAG: hypothetical protein ACLF0G_15965 [Candidatus Brocadiia bacterium]